MLESNYYWLWLVLGMLLIALEIVLPAFITLWFGLSAIVVGGIVFFLPDLSLSIQIFIWTLLSVITAFLWFKFLRPLSTDKTKAGLAREAIIGQTAMVIQCPTENTRGTLRLIVPFLGSDEWQFILQTEQEISNGDRVKIVDVSGNSLIVNKQ